MKFLPFILFVWVAASCAPESIGPVDANDKECPKSSASGMCQNESAEIDDSTEFIEEPGPLALNPVSGTPTGLITDANEAALIEAGLARGGAFLKVVAMTGIFLDIDVEKGTIDCESGSGYLDSKENDSGDSFVAYQVRQYFYDDCVSPFVSPFQALDFKVNGETRFESRYSLLSTMAIKWSASSYSVVVNSSESKSVYSSDGGWLSIQSLATGKSTLVFDYLVEDSNELGAGTFHVYSLTPVVDDNNYVESGSWVIEDSTGATIIYKISGAQENTVSVMARGVGMGDYDL